MTPILAAYVKHKAAASLAYKAFVALCGDTAPPRVPGCDTVIRLAWRIECGRTIEQAAAAEYLFRWKLAIKPADQVLDTRVRNPCVSIFGAPHTIGL